MPSKRQAKLNWTPSQVQLDAKGSQDCPETPFRVPQTPVLVESGSCGEPFGLAKHSVCCTSACLQKNIAVFAPGPPFGAISGDFASVSDPQSHRKRCRKRPRVIFGTLSGAQIDPRLIQVGPSRSQIARQDIFQPPRSTKVDPRSSKQLSSTDFRRFWIVRRAIWTRKTQCLLHFSISAKKITVFAPGPPFGAISGDFASVFDPQSHRKRCRKRPRVILGTLSGAI